ncbi:LOW QUALITY PROTEIN: hypothetical protein KUTeg_006029 [Tegillarca granosa]|uniref:Chitin-binding type-2 domain-containing protein n=1 Tax=Tegillarca granosa TaxID=220873 RepID=A0ABQ9FI99_TEGGR|nr:LOW QUALITY PROTEIN: hypothetical protein KUTeg_006029 [Tegillarca granosa]
MTEELYIEEFQHSFEISFLFYNFSGDYNKNRCDGKSALCEPCPDRHPSCVGAPDGQNKIPQKEWTSRYMVCYRNRTLDHKSCDVGIFHPHQRKCITTLHSGDLESYCKNSPRFVIGSSVNAAQYFNCTSQDNIYGKYIKECKYPDLFSTKTGKCENFRVVPKDSRPMPQAPCEYTQNRCNVLNENCSPCEKRHHSCVGLPDGNNPISGLNWTPYYITCLLNRTIAENKCAKGLFDPVKKSCVLDGYFDRIEIQCESNPTAVFKHPESCALFYNCSEYLQNGCKNNDSGCVPCPSRLPSCIGMLDGDNPITESIWSNAFVKCHKNRTVGKTECSYGYFDPTKKMCVDMLHPDDAAQFCKTNPYSTIRSSVSCAQYIDCSLSAPVISVCKYPDLFSPATMTCRDFRMNVAIFMNQRRLVSEYKQNLCRESNTSCTSCHDIMPSCVGLPNGYNAYPRREWSEHYIVCNKNRTLDIKTCDEGIFNPKQGRCVKGLDNGSIQEYCLVHKYIRIHNADNCAQYYDCSNKNSVYGPYLQECYLANTCPSTAGHCTSCPSRLPSCINLSDGDHPFTEGQQSSKYITCYKNRTKAVKNCQEGGLNPAVEECEYPSLFSVEHHLLNVEIDLNQRTPCDYKQYICKPYQEVCMPCPERHPSCVGLVDGYHPYPGNEWSSQFFVCEGERTMTYQNSVQPIRHQLFLTLTTVPSILTAQAISNHQQKYYKNVNIPSCLTDRRYLVTSFGIEILIQN